MRRFLNGFVILSLATILVGAAAGTAAADRPKEEGSGRYIVVLNEQQRDKGVLGTTSQQLQSVVKGLRVGHLYGEVLNGFSATIPNDQVEELRNDPRVAYLEADEKVSADGQSLPWGIDRVEADKSSTKAGNGSGAVSGVNAYAIDSGVAKDADLNVVQRLNFTEEPNEDCHGHGSHISGTIGARDNSRGVVGVAPGLPITSLKVLDCESHGWYSDMIAAIDWVTKNAKKPAVANMSIGGNPSQAVDDAIRRAVKSGVFFALSAGNKGKSACGQTPARAGAGTNNGILTVAALDSGNKEASFSNYGDCVDIWAPGVKILSTGNSGGIGYMSGTSMAAPHGAGAAALYLSKHRTATPAQVEAALKKAATSTGSKSKDGAAIKRVNTSGM
ncbi:S8 family peptidase [Microlunatus speluncae]|uniref:S8 family peptidase n=1 Tax=Microlunatus speluncae TaxID=2594267 RepID=UPI001375C7A6|nr:S8 family peptidase [Microlunatus speluncae]